MRVTPDGTTQSQFVVLLNVKTTSVPLDDSTGTHVAALATVPGMTAVALTPTRRKTPKILDIRRLFTKGTLAN
jgi:hypothetical protein